jgi:oxygen-independent coproporphyrinogen-3 oxidase
MRMDEDDEIRADLIQSLMCQGEVRVRAFQERHGIGFAEYFAADLQRLWPLADDGLVEVGPDAIRATLARTPVVA